MVKPGPKPRRKSVSWSRDLAYAVGLMASDGNLSKDGIHFTFVSKDYEQIQNIKKCLNIRANESRRPSGRPGDVNLYYRLQWGDVTLHDFLISIGLTPNKSLTLGTLKVPDEYFFDFLRGSFDGDGCFYSYFDPRWKNSFMYYVVFSSGSERHISWLRDSIARLIDIRGHLDQSKPKANRHRFFQLKYAKKEGLFLLRRLYTKSKGMRLSRKWLKIQKALRIVGESLRG